jgi:hypothetical protein
VAYLVISIPCFGLDNTIRFLAPGTPRILFFSSPLFGAVIRSFALLREIKLLKSKIAGLTNSKNGSTLTEESRELAKVVELHDKTWMTFRSQIAKSLVEEYKAIKSADARSLITESVEFRIKDGIRDFQSFLPPSVRLPASHFAPFLFTEEDVENFEVEQKDIANLLEEQLEPDYENETVVWA